MFCSDAFGNKRGGRSLNSTLSEFVRDCFIALIGLPFLIDSSFLLNKFSFDSVSQFVLCLSIKFWIKVNPFRFMGRSSQIRSLSLLKRNLSFRRIHRFDFYDSIKRYSVMIFFSLMSLNLIRLKEPITIKDTKIVSNQINSEQMNMGCRQNTCKVPSTNKLLFMILQLQFWQQLVVTP